MKKSMLIGALLAVCTALPAYATTLNFDDLQGNGGAMPDGYGGFNWNNTVTTGHVSNDVHPGSGYANGTVSGKNVVFNWYGDSPVTITSDNGAAFTFNSAYLTSAWSDQNIRLEGFFNSGKLYETSWFAINTQLPLLVSLNWDNINKLVIYNSGEQWAMDNFTFNETSNEVPEPVSLALLGLGLTGLAVTRRRSPQKAA